MADLPNRDVWERRMARLLGKLLAAYGGRLLEKLGDPPSLDNLPADFWEAEGLEFATGARPFLLNTFLEQAQATLRELPVGIDWALVNERAIAWVTRYTFDLVNGIQATDRRVIQRALTRFFRDDMNREQLEAMIKPSFGVQRASRIAVTEVTRAAAQAEQELVIELRGQGVDMRVRWDTNADDLVCPICSPLDGTYQGDGWTEPPPAHVNCRCSTALEIAP
jgi:hypothetical protein